MLASTGSAIVHFTGERVIPGAVEPDLWNEHISRYRFASLFSLNKRVLDVGCGTGYGTDLLGANAHQAVGLDIAPDAVRYASARFLNARFLCACAGALPFPARSLDVVTAFEVIEHLQLWECLLAETARVLTAEGIFLVSTPNKTYYAETRKEAGPNPFHVHEFELNDFRESLERHFPFVHILAQNQQQAIVFSSQRRAASENAFIPAVQDLEDSHFFLAICSSRPVAVPSFGYIASAGNLLRERETYILSLKAELAESRAGHLVLLDAHHRLEEETHRQLEQAGHSLDQLLRERESIKNSLWLRIGRTIGIGPWSSRAASLRALPRSVWEWLRPSQLSFTGILTYLACPFLLLLAALTLAAEDLCFRFIGKRVLPPETAPRNHAATIVVPNWNGHDLLKKFLPSLLKAVSFNPENEVIVVDDASSDGSFEFLNANYPQVKVLRLERNLGFAPAVNAGVLAAKHDIVVLLNNDMRVEPGFLSPLLENFTDPLLFAVSSQIFLSDRAKRREETGLTEVCWDHGRLRVSHRIDPELDMAYPCAYAGGGSSAFDRRKFLELGGFDTLFHPFYYEDTDLGFLAWKRGWKILYQPASVVHHEHRGTVGKNFSAAFINGVVHKNALLYCWKNIHDWRILVSHFGACLASSLKTILPENIADPCTPVDVRQAFSQLNGVMRSRWTALSHRKIADREAFRRPLGGYYRDRFAAASSPPPDRLSVLFASPYPIEPPVHGGAVFMKEALIPLSSIADVHLASLLDSEEQLPQQRALLRSCVSALFITRPHFPLTEGWTLLPLAIREFNIRDFAWLLHKTIYTKNIDVVQLEYTILGQYAGDYQHIPCMLFEHDISFQSLWRRIRTARPTGRLLLEFLRMRLYEPKLLTQMTRVQVCSDNDAAYLQQVVPKLSGRIDSQVRAGIDVSKYDFVLDNREPDTLLFIGSFRHLPNLDALTWFVREVFPQILRTKPGALLTVIGSDPPKSQTAWTNCPNVRVLGSVADIRIPLARYGVFVCPILSGSGVRVKLLEAFASGIPAVSTSIGAEGLASQSGDICEIANTPGGFATSVLKLLGDPAYRTTLAERAREMVASQRDAKQAAVRLEAVYRAEVNRMRSQAIPQRSWPARVIHNCLGAIRHA